MSLQFRLRILPLVTFIFLSAGWPAAAQSAGDLHKEGVLARSEQRFDAALELLEQALKLEPENADILVQLGFTQLALDQMDNARVSFEQVLSLTPDYQDARYGLAQVAFRNNDREQAQQLIETVLLAQPDNEDASGLLQKLSEPPPKNWRLDVGSEVSTLTGDRPSWTDSAIALSYKFEQGTTLSGRSRFVTRSDIHDTQFEARIDHVFSKDFSAYGLMAGTPYASIAPQFSIGGGATWRAAEGNDTFGPLYLNLTVRHDIHADSAITGLTSGVQYYMFNERASVSARWLHTSDGSGASTNGILVRVDMTLTDSFRIYAGYSYAPEITAGPIVETQTGFAGFFFDINDQLTLQASYSHEAREAFDRDTFSGGFSIRF